jgi:hypothetical protein
MRKQLVMVTGPEAFDNFTRLMRALLAVPKDKVSGSKPVKRKQRKPQPTSS